MSAIFICLHVSNSYATICAQDLNRDVFLDMSGETTDCINADGGPLCPFNLTDCGNTDSSGGGSKTMCVDAELYERIRKDGNNYIFEILDSIGPIQHKDCDSNGRDEWHELGRVTLARDPATINFCITSIGQGGCDDANNVCVNSVGVSKQVMICRQNGTQRPTFSYSYSTTGDFCPLGDAYACYGNSGKKQCSSNACVDLSRIPGTLDKTSYYDDGTRDATGACTGQFMLFNGKPGECRRVGVQTNFFNCCSVESGSLMFISKGCTDQEWTTDSQKNAGGCHYIGNYCAESWSLLGCVQQSEVYCCFKSKLARIIHEQGRVQLKDFGTDGGWGSVNTSNCVGFTPEQFQMLDFSKIDFLDYFSEIITKATADIQKSMSDRVNNFYGGLR